MRSGLFALLISSFALLPTAHASLFGTDQGNGGDIYSAEFVETGHEVVDLLRHNGSRDVNIGKLENAMDRTKVESTDQALALKGIPKDAINFPKEQHIIFNRKRWNAMDAGEKPTLVLHEYLGIIGVNDSSYDISRKILGAFRYDFSYQIDCKFKNGKGDLNMGIDESYGGDKILLTVNPSRVARFMGFTDQPQGKFSQMIRNGAFQMAFEGDVAGLNSYLVALMADSAAYSMSGQIAMNGQVTDLSCQVKKYNVPSEGNPAGAVTSK